MATKRFTSLIRSSSATICSAWLPQESIWRLHIGVVNRSFGRTPKCIFGMAVSIRIACSAFLSSWLAAMPRETSR